MDTKERPETDVKNISRFDFPEEKTTTNQQKKQTIIYFEKENLIGFVCRPLVSV